MPSGEHLTARKATKLKFVQLESEQLRTYMEDLESSLNLYKQMLQDILSVRPNEPSLSEESDTLSLMSPRLFESLIAEKRILEERLRRNIIDRNDAANKALYHEQQVLQSKSKEECMVKDFEEKIRSLLVESEYKERIIKDLQHRNGLLEKDVELYNKSKEKQLSVSDQKELLKRKGETMVRILMKLEKKYDVVYRDIQHLLAQCNELVAEYRRGNSMLREPQPEVNSEVFVEFYNRDISCDEFWVTEEKNLKKILSELGIDFGPKPDFNFALGSPKAGPMGLSKLERNQEKLKAKCDEYQIKLQTITQEIESAKRLKQLLKQDQVNLRQSIEQNKTLEREQTGKVMPRASLPADRSEEGRKLPRNLRSNSNPLDYAQFNFNEGKRKQKKKEMKPKEFNEVEDKDVSLILPSIGAEDIMDDSLMDIFDAEDENPCN